MSKNNPRRSRRLRYVPELDYEGEDDGFSAADSDEYVDLDSEMETLQTLFGELTDDDQIIGFADYYNALGSSAEDCVKHNACTHFLDEQPSTKYSKLVNSIGFYDITGALPSYVFDDDKLNSTTLSTVFEIAKCLASLLFRGKLAGVLAQFPAVRRLMEIEGYGPKTLQGFMTAYKKAAGAKNWDQDLTSDLKAHLAAVIEGKISEIPISVKRSGANNSWSRCSSEEGFLASGTSASSSNDEEFSDDDDSDQWGDSDASSDSLMQSKEELERNMRRVAPQPSSNKKRRRIEIAELDSEDDNEPLTEEPPAKRPSHSLSKSHRTPSTPARSSKLRIRLQQKANEAPAPMLPRTTRQFTSSPSEELEVTTSTPSTQISETVAPKASAEVLESTSITAPPTKEIIHQQTTLIQPAVTVTETETTTAGNDILESETALSITNKPTSHPPPQNPKETIHQKITRLQTALQTTSTAKHAAEQALLSAETALTSLATINKASHSPLHNSIKIHISDFLDREWTQLSTTDVERTATGLRELADEVVSVLGEAVREREGARREVDEVNGSWDVARERWARLEELLEGV